MWSNIPPEYVQQRFFRHLQRLLVAPRFVHAQQEVRLWGAGNFRRAAEAAVHVIKAVAVLRQRRVQAPPSGPPGRPSGAQRRRRLVRRAQQLGAVVFQRSAMISSSSLSPGVP